MSNPIHVAHFNDCFEKFMDRSNSISTRSNISSGVNSVLAGEEGVSGGIPSTSQDPYGAD